MGRMTRSLSRESAYAFTLRHQHRVPAPGITMTESRFQPLPALGPLLPCPFCGGEAAVEADPWSGESARIACGNPSCGVAPKTEYLLLRFADELRCAWNHRPGREKQSHTEARGTEKSFTPCRFRAAPFVASVETGTSHP